MDNEHWLRDSKAARRAGVSRMTWWRWGKDGKRPEPDGTDPNGHNVWLASTIDRLFREGKGA